MKSAANKEMSKKRVNKEQKKNPDPLDLFSGESISWNKSSHEIWALMQDKLPERDKIVTSGRSLTFIRLAVAAILILLIGIPTLMRFYTRTVESGNAEHLSVILPDGSSIALNAETKIEYNPLWWKFKRDVRLSGEAYFEVVKGKDFIVESEKASTAVLGTSFNIFSRGNSYVVTCLSGKVKVFAADKDSEVFLLPEQKAILDDTGYFKRTADGQADRSISWTDNELSFTSVPLDRVFDEIERQYGIIITADTVEELIYTGNFSRNQDVDTILDLVCMPFGIKFEKINDRTYLVSKDERIN